jgi:Fe-S-cluster containining protein
MERIAAFLKLDFDKFTRTYVRRIGNRYSLTEKFNYDCTFLTRDKDGKAGCSIYSVRPMQCRTWPFWTDNLKTPTTWKNAAAKCPGIKAGQGPLYNLEYIERCRQDPGSPQ